MIFVSVVVYPRSESGEDQSDYIDLVKKTLNIPLQSAPTKLNQVVSDNEALEPSTVSSVHTKNTNMIVIILHYRFQNQVNKTVILESHLCVRNKLTPNSNKTLVRVYNIQCCTKH